MTILSRNRRPLQILVAACVLCLTGCGSAPRPTNSGTFAGRANSATPAETAAVANVSVNPTSLIGGNIAQVTVHLAQPAPEGGLAVQLKTSDARVATVPIFWSTDFANQKDMSALWYVGNSTSQCVNYELAPACP